ncbi:hypothetical protein [Sphingobium boeckii]|uniref:Uncharacterized protein n=1 Tax=Sphingobium boeckii TaxID=1082345 RepID=A0A7W9EFC3_9SPHN|nr:hypothetical protein [Sphingobium boeckii]MBB5687092.1 hypothetical protein [Sphingobium boeckii]
MSRAINLNATEDAVRTACTSLSVQISAIEPLLSGGTRVVLSTSVGAEALRIKMKTKIMQGRVERSPFYMAR